MFGGINDGNLYGDLKNAYYFIGDFGEIDASYISENGNNKQYLLYSLEEFEKKFPYKVGDKVYNIIDGKNQTITKNCFGVLKKNEVIYQTNNNEWVFVNYLQPYKEETMEEELIPKIDFNKYCKDKYLLDLGNYEIKKENGKTYAVRKQPEYPKTYEECCKVLGYEPNRQSVTGYHAELIEKFQQLLICRDAYWRIAGEQMGLGKPWKPDWSSANSIKFILYTCENKIHTGISLINNDILAFPTEEMRNEFLENFRDLIEQCKELL